MDELALFPLQTVLFPGNKLPLRIFEPRYVDLVGRCMREGSRFGIVAIEHGEEVGATPAIFSTGTDVDIIDFDQGSAGLLNIIVQGRERFTIDATRRDSSNLLTASVHYLPNLEACDFDDPHGHLEAMFNELSRHPELQDRISATNDNLEMAFQVIPWLPIPPATKVTLLAAETSLELLSSLESYLEQLDKSNRS